MPLATVLDQRGVDSLDLLKIDAEGAEYAVLVDHADPSGLGRVRRITGEYHKVEGRHPDEILDALSSSGVDIRLEPFSAHTIDDEIWTRLASNGEPPGLGTLEATRR